MMTRGYKGALIEFLLQTICSVPTIIFYFVNKILKRTKQILFEPKICLSSSEQTFNLNKTFKYFVQFFLNKINLNLSSSLI